MANNTTEKNIRNLFDNIEKQLQAVDFKKQPSLIEIDILLEKCRRFYEECVQFRAETAQQIADKKAEEEKYKLNIPSLFGDEWDNDETPSNSQPIEEKKTTTTPVVEQPATDETIENKGIEQNKKEQDITETSIEEPKIEEQKIENTNIEDTNIEEPQPIAETTINNNLVEEETKVESVSQIENDTPTHSQPIEENQEVFFEEEQEEKVENKEIESITEFAPEEEPTENENIVDEITIDDSMFDIYNTIDIEPKVEPKIESDPQPQPIVSNQNRKEIDLDNIEFEEETQDFGYQPTPQKHTEPQHIQSRRTPPAYWGDEIDIENPIQVKNVSISEKYQQSRPSVNDMVSGMQNNDTLGLSLGHGSSDLMNSIDINNKFLFVKELFKNNGSLFTEEINKLNDFKRLTDLLPYLEQLKQKYNWKENSEAYQELYRLLLRKFSTKHK
ncbi:MAG: hypothetical protein J5606_10490 [Bacteroidales bacterium]|nr:hypothetical protein [Bacteroidales bacterium]